MITPRPVHSVVRRLALGGVVGPIVFVATWAIAGATTNGYSAIDDAISDLAAVGASARGAMTVAFLVFGLGLVAFGGALRCVLDGPAWLAAAATGMCTIGVALTPLGGWAGDGAHAAFAGAGYATLVAVPVFAAAPLRREGHSAWARASVVVALIAAVCLLASTLGPAHGLWQRLGLTIGDAWIVVTALAVAGILNGPYALRCDPI